MPLRYISGPLVFLFYVNYLADVSTVLFSTHYIVFTLTNAILISNICNDVRINGISVSKVEPTKFLGVYIDSKLSWSSHLKYLISKGIGVICPAKRQLNITTLLSLYNCFVYPYFPYCIEIWWAAADVHVQQIIKLQKTDRKNNKFFKVIGTFCSNISEI